MEIREEECLVKTSLGQIQRVYGLVNRLARARLAGQCAERMRNALMYETARHTADNTSSDL